jgi:lysophospholipase L1-like esterase
LVKKVTRNKIPVDERLPYLLEFNDWVRSYAAQEGLVVLDLEAALRNNAQERKLRPDLAGEDGLHLNEQAYRVLDRLVVDSAGQLFKETGPGH